MRLSPSALINMKDVLRILLRAGLAMAFVCAWSLSLALADSDAKESRQRVVIVKSRDNAFYAPTAQGFINGLKSRGYRSGERIEIHTIALTGKPEADMHLLQDENQKHPALFLSLGTDATRLLAALKPSVPVFFSLVLNPVTLGVVHSMEAPGGNFTGTTLLVSPGKQFDALMQIKSLRRIGVLYTDEDTTSLALIEEARGEAKQLNVELIAVAVKEKQTSHDALNQLSGQVDALWVIPDPASTSPQAFMDTLEFAKAHKLPVLGASSAMVHAGALASLSANLEDLGDVTAEMASHALDGSEAPAQMRVRGPRKTVLTISIQAAREAGIKLPDAILHLADEVIDTSKEER